MALRAWIASGLPRDPQGRFPTDEAQKTDPSGFGEGQTYAFTATEGTADGDATSSTYGPGAVNGSLSEARRSSSLPVFGLVPRTGGTSL